MHRNFSRRLSLKSIAGFLLILCVFQQGGNLLLWEGLRFKARQEMKTRIKSHLAREQALVLRLSPSVYQNGDRFYWEHSREFHLDGKMYDLIRPAGRQGDTLVLECLRDWKETRLYAQLGNLIGRQLQKPANQDVLLSGLSAFLQVYILPATCLLTGWPSSWLCSFPAASAFTNNGFVLPVPRPPCF